MTVAISGDPLISGVVLTEQASTPSSPGSGKRKLYVDTTGALKLVDSAGTAVAAGAAGAVPLALVDAKGDLIVGSAADAVLRLPAGTDGHVLTADAAAALGLKWAAPGGGGGGGYATVQEEGTSLSARTTLNVVGRGALADDTGSLTRLRVGDAVTTAHLVDDFLCATTTGTAVIGDLGWTGVGAGGAASGPAGEAGHPGIYRLGVGTTSGSVIAIILRNTTTAAPFLAAESWDIQALVRLVTNDANTIARIGLGVSVTGTPSDGAYVEKTAADTSWFGTCRAATVESRTAALVACSTGWVAFGVRRVDASTIGFRTATTLGGLAGASEATLGTNVPTSTQILPFLQIANTAAAAKSMDVDLWDLLITGLSR